MLPYLKKNIQILALEIASPGNQHCANCIGTLSFPMETGGRTDSRTDTTDRISFRASVVANYARPAGGQSHFHAKMQRQNKYQLSLIDPREIDD